MPKVTPQFVDSPWAGGTSTTLRGSIGTLTTTGASANYIEVTGYKGALWVCAINGATNGASFTVEVSCDGAAWFTAGTRANASATYATAAVAVSAGATQLVFLSPVDTPRYIRVNQASANVNGTVYEVWGEK